jgi:hypothetical protein
MQRVAEWLNTLGLGQYAQRFADNDIDTNILRDLTDADLEKNRGLARASQEIVTRNC